MATTDQDGTPSPEELEHDIERTREQLGETVEALARKADVKGRAHDAVDDAKIRVSGQMSHAKDTATHTVGQVKQSASTAAENTDPRVAAAGAAVVLAVIAAVLWKRHKN